MPKVDIMYKQGKVEVWQFAMIANAIKKAVAGHLACEDHDGGLTPHDVEIFFHEIGSHDDCKYDLAINVSANYYPSRAANKDERADKIRDDLDAALATMRWCGEWYIWVQLSLASFREGVIA